MNQADDATSAPTAPDVDAPRIPDRLPGERVAVLANQRPLHVFDEVEVGADDAPTRVIAPIREPLSDLLLRFALVLVLLVMAGLAGLIGAHYQTEREVYTRGDVPVVGHYINRLHDLLSYMGVVGFVGVVTLTLWSGLVVYNATRVYRSLRSPWIASITWLIAPGLGVLAHLTLDRRLASGTLIGFVVFLAALYIPFGTIGSTTAESGGSPHLARVWFLASVVAAFLLIVGIAGSTRDLPFSNPEDALRFRALACYLAALMLVAAAALAYGTAQTVSALISHRWQQETDPDFAYSVGRLHSTTRSSKRARRWAIPTLFLRALVALALLGSACASVFALFWLRGRGLRIDNGTDPIGRKALLDHYHRVILEVAVVGIAAHCAYIVWAIVASINARRKSIMAPPAIAVAGAFLAGPALAMAGVAIGKEPGAAVSVTGGVLAVGGYIIAQLVLGRTVSALGGRGQIFVGWMIVDAATVTVAILLSRYTATPVELFAYGLVQMALGILAAALAWTAMTRLDRVCRAQEPPFIGRRRVVLSQPTSGVGSPVASAALTSS
ncbi:MAG TPA: hypothetical protein VGM78_03790, partial [Ilumatobacteraceae bacterium]